MPIVYDTPGMEEILEGIKDFQMSDHLLNRISYMCQDRGFKLYKLSACPSAHDFKILIMCGLYQSIRCPFTMTFKRPDIPGARFMLIRYRSEHNHPLNNLGFTRGSLYTSHE